MNVHEQNKHVIPECISHDDRLGAKAGERGEERQGNIRPKKLRDKRRKREREKEREREREKDVYVQDMRSSDCTQMLKLAFREILVLS